MIGKRISIILFDEFLVSEFVNWQSEISKCFVCDAFIFYSRSSYSFDMCIEVFECATFRVGSAGLEFC